MIVTITQLRLANFDIATGNVVAAEEVKALLDENTRLMDVVRGMGSALAVVEHAGFHEFSEGHLPYCSICYGYLLMREGAGKGEGE